jgi:hypothetical protein
MKKTAKTLTAYSQPDDYSLRGKNYLFVTGDGKESENVRELKDTYALAKKISPNKIAKSATNRMTIIVAPGIYTFGTSKLVLDTPFIDIVSLTGNCDVLIDGISITGNDINVRGIDTGTNAFTITGTSVTAEKCKGLNYVSDAPLDFLFVDSWDSVSNGSDNVIGRIRINTYEGDAYMAKLIAEGEEKAIAGFGSVPYVPISQTTIFIHPTTFERYMFNGATMFEYNDVDGVVPKWLKYEALLTQNGTDAPVARVLNADERDYLGDILFTIPIDFGNSFVANNNKLIKELLFINGEGIDQDGEFCSFRYIDGDSQNGSILFCYTAWEGIKSPSRTDFKLKQRVRGNPPKLISAETNTVGDKVILTFDKKMSGYNIDIVIRYIVQYADNQQCGSIEFDSLSDNIILCKIEPILFGQNCTICLADQEIESFDFGLLQLFENFPVKNNVTE